MKEPRAKGLEAYSPARRVEARCPLTNRTPGRPTPSRIRTPHSRSWPPATGRPGARGGVSRGGVGRAAASPAHRPSRGGTGSARPDCRGGAGGLHADPRERRSDSGGSRERGSGGDRRRRARPRCGSLAGEWPGPPWEAEWWWTPPSDWCSPLPATTLHCWRWRASRASRRCRWAHRTTSHRRPGGGAGLPGERLRRQLVDHDRGRGVRGRHLEFE